MPRLLTVPGTCAITSVGPCSEKEWQDFAFRGHATVGPPATPHPGRIQPDRPGPDEMDGGISGGPDAAVKRKDGMTETVIGGQFTSSCRIPPAGTALPAPGCRPIVEQGRARRQRLERPPLRMRSRGSTWSDRSAPSIPVRGTVLAFGSQRCGAASVLPPLSALGCLTSLACLGLVGSEEAHPKVLASVRRSNCTCGFPACSFHEDTALRCEKRVTAEWPLVARVRLSQAPSILGR
jgi:hypothetical protein